MFPLEFALHIFAQTVILFLGIFVLVNNPKKKTNQVFFLFILSVIFWVSCVFLADFLKNYHKVMFWTKMSIIGPVFSAIFFYYFSSIFPQKNFEISNRIKILIFLSIILFLILSPTSLNIKNIEIKEWGTDFTPGPLYLLLFIHIIFFFGLAFKNLRKNYITAQEKIQKYQILYLSAAFSIGVIVAMLTNIIFPFLGFAYFSKYGPSLSILFFVLITSIAILKHHLLNVKVILTEALVFLLISILIIKIPISKNTSELIFNTIILVLTTVVGLGLIRSVIWEIKRREEIEKITNDLKKAYKKLQILDQAKSEFISIASHQLRTPLTAIKGYISLIQEKLYGSPPAKMKRPLENIYISTERLIKLVNDLLSISRIEAGKIKAELEISALEDIIDSVVEELKNLAKEKGLYLKWEKPKEPLPKLLLDKDKIRQVVLNVIDNAIRYTKKGGVVIKAISKENSCVIEVRDTGPGMTEEEISRLFESFRRGSAGKRTWTGGAGLGLYIAKKFLDMHNGKIWAESPGINKGSIFYIEIPIKKQ